MEVLVLIVLIVFNAIFAMTEMSIGASRRGVLLSMIEDGESAARDVLDLLDDPGRLLAASQIGLTAIAMLSGVYGESFWVPLVIPYLPSFMSESVSHGVALGLVVSVITFFSIVFGEIIPKRCAMAKPEKIACLMAKPVKIYSMILKPFISILSKSGELVLSPFGLAKKVLTEVGTGELKAMIRVSRSEGGLDEVEGAMLENVLKLDDRLVPSIMTPATAMDWIDSKSPMEEIRSLLSASPRVRYPLCNGNLQEVLGVVEMLEILPLLLKGEGVVSSICKPCQMVPATLSLYDLLVFFRDKKTHFALVIGEFGQVEGLVTISDLLGTVVGTENAMPEEDPLAVMREDGSWLIDGLLPVDEMVRILELDHDEDYTLTAAHTVGGFVMASLGRIPKKTDSFQKFGWVFEVIDVDHRRVDEVMVRKVK